MGNFRHRHQIAGLAYLARHPFGEIVDAFAMIGQHDGRPRRPVRRPVEIDVHRVAIDRDAGELRHCMSPFNSSLRALAICRRARSARAKTSRRWRRPPAALRPEAARDRAWRVRCRAAAGDRAASPGRRGEAPPPARAAGRAAPPPIARWSTAWRTASSSARSSSFLARSIMRGTCGSPGFLSTPVCTKRLIFLSPSHCASSVLMIGQGWLMASISPRSIAMLFLAGPRIAVDQLELGAEHAVEHQPVEPRRDAAGRDDQLARKRVLDLLDRREMPGIQHRAVADDAADPVEPRRVGAQLRRAENLIEIDGLVDHADDRAVLGGLVVEIVRRPDGDGARHVQRDHGGMPGQVPAEMRGDQAAIGVVAAADRIADDEVDGLALVEILRRRARDEAWSRQDAREQAEARFCATDDSRECLSSCMTALMTAPRW